MKKKLILTFDLDFWYSGEFFKKYLPQNKNSLEDFIEEPMIPLLDLLKKYNQKATFFVLGKISEKYPQLIKKISQAGHEIASHGYSHTILKELGPNEFEKEILKTNQIIEKILNKKIIGFRAPNFSLNQETNWAFKILEKNDFQYDSSFHPLTTKKITNNSLIKEFPSSLGGYYFRALPLFLYLRLIKKKSIDFPIIYLHPYELFASSPKLKSAPWLKKKIKYIGIKKSFNKFEKLLKKFKFISIEQYINENITN